MSRIGNKILTIPASVTITVEDNEIDVTKLKCTSFFIAHFGAVEKELPEMNGFILSNDTNFFYVPLMHIIEKLSL